MASVLRRYLSRELLQYWLVFTLVLWLVLIAARLSLYLGQAAGGELPADAVLLLLGLKSVGFLVFLMPFSLFLALLYLLGRLNQDYESLAMAVAGAGPQQLYRMLALPVLTITLLVAVLSGYLVPHTAQLGYDLRAKAEQQLDAGALSPGRFHRLKNGRWLVFARGAGAEPDSLADVFVYIEHPQRPQVLVAEAGRVRTLAGGERYLVLQKGYRYDGEPGQADYRVLRYQEYALRLQTPPAPQTRRDALSTASLWRDASPAAHAEL
ncbi:MAG: LptF/LptG family permease, partial [Thiogranum sp.]|nr:LptF/LptG family permease [Thiogranum sp.]